MSSVFDLRPNRLQQQPPASSLQHASEPRRALSTPTSDQAWTAARQRILYTVYCIKYKVYCILYNCILYTVYLYTVY